MWMLQEIVEKVISWIKNWSIVPLGLLLKEEWCLTPSWTVYLWRSLHSVLCSLQEWLQDVHQGLPQWRWYWIQDAPLSVLRADEGRVWPIAEVAIWLQGREHPHTPAKLGGCGIFWAIFWFKYVDCIIWCNVHVHVHVCIIVPSLLSHVSLRYMASYKLPIIMTAIPKHENSRRHSRHIPPSFLQHAWGSEHDTSPYPQRHCI